jgi:hypothetical protein
VIQILVRLGAQSRLEVSAMVDTFELHQGALNALSGRAVARA